MGRRARIKETPPHTLYEDTERPKILGSKIHFSPVVYKHLVNHCNLELMKRV